MKRSAFQLALVAVDVDSVDLLKSRLDKMLNMITLSILPVPEIDLSMTLTVLKSCSSISE